MNDKNHSIHKLKRKSAPTPQTLLRLLCICGNLGAPPSKSADSQT